MPSKQLHNEVLAGGCEAAKHHGTERRKRRPASRLQCLTLPSDRQETSSKVQLSCPQSAPQQSPSGRLRNSKTPWPWRTERARRQRLHNKLLAGGCETAQHHGPEGRNAPAGNGPQCLTLPSEPTRNQLQSAAPMPSKKLHNEVLAGGCETAKHHGPEGRNDLQKHAVPRLDVSSGFW